MSNLIVFLEMLYNIMLTSCGMKIQKSTRLIGLQTGAAQEEVKFKVLSNNSSLEVLKLLRRIDGRKLKVLGEYAESISCRIHLIRKKTKLS
jgi:hypothetical protein